MEPQARILILGAGREGIATLRYLKQASGYRIGLYDQKPLDQLPSHIQDEIKKTKDLTLHLGVDLSRTTVDAYGTLIRSPGIPPKSIPSGYSGTVTSATQIFFDEFPGIVIGVTGTKGKSTTSSLIHAMLQACGKTTLLVGNIGAPALDILPQSDKSTYAVFELSSHQLLDLTTSPHIAVILGIFEEHLDYYHDVKDYVQAKTNIAEHQSSEDYVIFDSDNKDARSIADLSQGKKIPYGEKDIQEVRNMRTKLQGDMNLRNIVAAKKAAEALGCGKDAMSRAVEAFEPLPHRLEKVGEVGGVIYYNDSLATTPYATIEALKSLKRVTTLIVGGFDRGLQYASLADAIRGSAVKTLILFPETGAKIWEEIGKKETNATSRYTAFTTSSMHEAVVFAAEHTRENEVCLLSPAAASFNLFRDYAERGDAFKAEVTRLKQQ